MKTCAPRQSAWRCTQILWERACSRKRLSRRPVFCGCTGLFASKLAPTGQMCCRGRHTGIFDDDMRPNAEALGVVHKSCSRKRLSRRPVFCVCTGLFASKLAPTGPRRCRGRHAAVFDDDMRPPAEALGVVRRLCGSELARESDCPDALFSVATLASSRASSLPQDRCAAGDGTPPYLMTTCAPTLKRLALYTNLVGARRCRGRHAAVFDEDMRPHAEALGVVHRSCGSELARESDCPDALFFVSALAYSRASSLPQDRGAAGDGTPAYLMTTCAPTPKRLALYTGFCGSELARESDCPDALFFVSALASSRASSLPQDRCAAGDGTPPYLMTTCAPTLKRLALYTGLVGAISTRRGDET
ncbi:hypothetical protein JOE39_004240 [Pseudomonas sp. PvP100]|nr:hypothetical protein [Pseudomonas sp. PvP007]MBP1196261.1 hypothetical protein [Pseudomonas sp. PvP100]